MDFDTLIFIYWLITGLIAVLYETYIEFYGQNKLDGLLKQEWVVISAGIFCMGFLLIPVYLIRFLNKWGNKIKNIL
jgi:hypothetical protein